MQFVLNSSTCRIIGAMVFVFSLSLSQAAGGAPAAQTNTAMPAAQQNAIVQKYCAVCHDDSHRNGGLSLQHFDAAQVEPALAAMMISKLKSGAMGAAGLGVPDRPTQDRFFDALMAKSAGADIWTLTRIQDPATQSPLLTASIVRESPSTDPKNPELYRLKLTCRPDTREAEMQLTWSPQPANSGRAVSVAVDDRTPVTYTVEGREKMGNGAKRDGIDVTSGPASAILYTSRPNAGNPNLSMPLPVRRLAISKVLADETVMFPFDSLTQSMRQDLSTCFTGRSVSR